MNKNLYELKKAPRQWYRKFESFMVDHGFHKIQADHYVFVKRHDRGDSLILLLYVDDKFTIGQDPKKIGILKKVLNKSFAMKDMDSTKQILGMHIAQDGTNRLLWLS